MYRTLFQVKKVWPEPHIDGSFTWPDPDGLTGDQLKEAALVTARLTGGPVEEPMAVTATKAFRWYEMRRRFDTMVEGPYLVVTEEQPTDEELLAWWKKNQQKTFRLHA